jgi:uncharacterized membrane protein YfcA
MTYAASAVLLLIGALLQSIIGFGMGVLTIPIFVWLGVGLETAVGLLVPSVLFQTSFNCWQNRELLPWKDVWLPYLLRLTFLPIGVWVLSHIKNSDSLGRQVLAVTVMGIIIGQILTRRSDPNRDIAKWWVIPAATSSGFMAGLIGMGGPSLVLWVAHQQWHTQRQRAFLWLSFLLVVPFQGMFMGLQFGPPMWTTFLFGTLLVPFVVVGAWLGNRIGNRLTPERLRVLMYSFLIIICVRLVVAK